MKTKLRYNLFAFFIIGALSMHHVNAQADIEFTFDGTTWEGWTPQGGTGAFVSVFANSNPSDALNISWSNVGANTRNIIMYGSSSVATMNADDRKFYRIRISNTSSEIGIMRIRGRVASVGTFQNFIDVPISQDASGSFSTYNFEITNAAYTGTLDRFQIIFRSASNAVLSANSNTDAILVDNVLVSANTTLSTQDNNSITTFNLSSNPVKDELTIRSSDIIEKVEIYNLLGKNVLSAQNTNSINVSALRSSIYIVRVFSENGISSKKFIKE